MKETCKKCNGMGMINMLNECPKCKGTGRIEIEQLKNMGTWNVGTE